MIPLNKINFFIVGVPKSGTTYLKRVLNKNNKIFLFINIFLKNRKIMIIAKKIKSIFGIKNFSFIMKPIKNNFVKPKLDTWIRSEENVENEKMMYKSLLKKEFEESIYSLSKITGRNLTGWLKS